MKVFYCLQIIEGHEICTKRWFTARSYEDESSGTQLNATLGVGYSWLDEPVETWPENPDYQKLHKFAHHLPVDNAATERMIRRTFLYRNYGKRSEDHFQATLAVVGAAIA